MGDRGRFLGRYAEALAERSLLSFTGSVVKVRGLVVEAEGPRVGVGELCEVVTTSGKRALAEVVGFEGHHRLLIPLDSVTGVAPGDAVLPHKSPQFLSLGPELLGRVLDGLGRPIDGKGELACAERRPVEADSPHPLQRRKITEPFNTGIRVIDGVLTCGKGQRLGIFSGSGVGKSVLLGEFAKLSEADVNVLALVGERGREVRHFLEDCLGEEGLAKSVVVVATSDTSPVQRVKAAFVATTIAEYFRDRDKNVLFMMDSITRLAQAQREIGLSAGEPPTTKGYPPSVFHTLPKITERLGAAQRGSITGICTVLVEADDLNEPVADAVRSLLDGHVVLSRGLADQGHYPAVDMLSSVSRLMDRLVDGEHLAAARRLKAIYATYRDAEDLINIGAYTPGTNRRIDLAVALIDRINEFLRQPPGERARFDETRERLVELTAPWEASSGEQPAAMSEARAGTGQG